MPPPRHPPSLDVPAAIDGVDEATWLDVIQKMDEVYSQLVADETALEEKNRALELSQQFIVSLITSMSDVLVACDAEGRIEQTNAALCRLVGRSDAELRGRSIDELPAGAVQVERQRAALRAATADARAVEIEWRDAAGLAVPVDLNITPRHDALGRTVGQVVVGRPLGELKRAYHELRETHEALKRTQAQLLHSEKLASLGRLVAGVAHELNNPISFVLGNAHALQRYSERLRSYLGALHEGAAGDELARLRARLRIDALLQDLPSLMEGMLEGAQRTADIVQGLRRFSAMDREERAPVELCAVIERAIHWVRKGTAPTFDVHWQAPEPLWVHGSAGQLLQVVMNLVQNAWDAASAGERAPQLWIEAGAAADETVVRVTLRDNGPGIAPEQLTRVFDPFFTTKPVGKGTGLGLSISYGLIEQHGGRLWAENAPQGGACFTFDLPRAPEPERTPA